jgi:transposase
VRVAEEPNVELLRQKASILEAENERLSRRISELLREILTLKGMTSEQVALNLPGLLPKAAIPPASKLTKPGSEQRPHAHQGEQPDKPQRGHGPTAQPNLPVIAETYDADEADKTCPKCAGALEEWEGQEDETELVDVIERQWVVRKRKQKKYRCRCGDCIEVAEAPAPLIKGGRYAPGVAIAVATSKYLDQTPLERQVQIARRQGAQLTTQTLWDQVSALADLMTPLYERIKAAILQQPVIGVDESPFKLILKGGSVKWQAWQMSSPIGTYFEILSAKSAEMGGQLLKGYRGVAMVDGAQTYKALAREGPFSLANCWSHARRHVLAAEGEAPGQVAQLLDMVGELYTIDRKAADEPAAGDRRRGYRHRLDLEKLRVLRDTESRAVITRLQSWILAQQCLPGGALKAGLEYVARRWTALTRFLDNPLIPLDNNRTEAGYIWLAIGRRNYLGARSEHGTRVAGVFYTIFETARLCGVDPEAYLRYATEMALRGDAPLLPHEWAAAQPAR